MNDNKHKNPNCLINGCLHPSRPCQTSSDCSRRIEALRTKLLLSLQADFRKKGIREEDAEDLVHDVLSKLKSGERHWDQEREIFTFCRYSVAKSLLSHKIEKSKKEKEKKEAFKSESILHSTSPTDPHTDLSNERIKQRIIDMLGKPNYKQYITAILSGSGQEKPSELALQLGCDVKKVYYLQKKYRKIIEGLERENELFSPYAMQVVHSRSQNQRKKGTS